MRCLCPSEGEQEEKYRRLNIPLCCISRHIELNFDALKNCNYFMEMYIDKLRSLRGETFTGRKFRNFRKFWTN